MPAGVFREANLMFRAPRDPEEIFPAIVDDYRHLFGNDLISIIVYGSAASGDYIPGKSDINFMVILSEKGIDSLDCSFKMVEKWKKRSVATPLFLTEDYVRTSLDTFPIEYLNFQNGYELVYGKDILKDITFDLHFLRLQCEREVKGKLLLLRQAFLETSGKGKYLIQLIGQSILSFIAIFRGLLYLKGEKPPLLKRDVIHQTCESFNIDGTLFEKLLDIKEKRTKPSGTEVSQIFQAYLKEVQKLWKIVDSLEIEGKT